MVRARAIRAVTVVLALTCVGESELRDILGEGSVELRLSLTA